MVQGQLAGASLSRAGSMQEGLAAGRIQATPFLLISIDRTYYAKILYGQFKSYSCNTCDFILIQ